MPLSPIDLSEVKALDKETVKFVINEVKEQRRNLKDTTNSSFRTA